MNALDNPAQCLNMCEYGPLTTLFLSGDVPDIHASLDQADRLLLEQRPCQAVQEILWLLETVSTAFHG